MVWNRQGYQSPNQGEARPHWPDLTLQQDYPERVDVTICDPPIQSVTATPRRNFFFTAAAHPGWTATNLQKDSALIRWFNPLFGMKPAQGALPSLYAATADNVAGGDYFGPGGFYEMKGYPKKVKSVQASHDADVAARLWQVSEELTQVRFDALERSATSAN